MASGGDDHSVRLWDLASHAQRGVLDGHTGAVWAMAFSPDGHTLVTGGTTVQLWKVDASLDPAQAIERICRTVTRNLTAEERAASLHDTSAGPVCPAT